MPDLKRDMIERLRANHAKECMMEGLGQPATHFACSVTTPHGAFTCRRRKPATALSLYRIKEGWAPVFKGVRAKPGDVVPVWHRMPLKDMLIGPAGSLCSFAKYVGTWDLQGNELSITKTITTKVKVAPK